MEGTGHHQTPVTVTSWKDSTLPVEQYKAECAPQPVPRRNWGGFVKMSIKEIMWEGMKFVKLVVI